MKAVFTRATIALAVVATLAVGAAVPASAATSGDDRIETATNAYRASYGVDDLGRNGGVDSVAQSWAEHMRSTRTLAHNPKFGSQMPQRGLSSWGENVGYACGYGGVNANTDAIIKGWKNSSGHRANMLRSTFTDIGIGVAYDSGRDCVWAVQDFGRYTAATSAAGSMFWDVPASHQFHDEIEWLATEEITTGYADGTFRPSNDVTREAFAAFLYRYAGEPRFSAPSRSPFKDVSSSSQFYKEISWLASTGITTGWSDGTFRPKQEISREAMAAFLYRYSGEPGFSAPSRSPFKDMDSGDQFYREVVWLRSTGITTGFADGTFRPSDDVTREATAAFFERASSIL
ncbi:S-layer homology domain-containing protein [Demequina sp. NBRC 110055]|uniref:CAP and S-layer homology domain-containing protein n=1 Tax=Demequina sp. NBRC 110055 TaxID=1570344 RepID=UPI0009FE4754|nr:S-layer homology domain-containing protein [Demequina sp. NBRC 110055]